jgi:nucleoside-diphosphate-sugar epimerase
MSQARAFVTGASGFTGSHLCDRLAKEGYAVRGLVRDPSRAIPLQRAGVEVAVGDLTDNPSLQRAVKGSSVVYHIAAEFRHDNLSRKQMMAVNVDGTRNMLEAALQEGVQKFVHCSTIGVHGDIKNPPADENAPCAPGDIYQESKLEAERIVTEYMFKDRLPIVIFRPGGIYGPGDLRFLKLIKAVRNGHFVMLGSGRPLYQMIYINDLIDGILLCGTKREAVGNIYILTGHEAVTLNDLVKTIAEVLCVRPPWLRFPVTPVYMAGLMCEIICKPFGLNPPLYRRRVDFFRKSRCFTIAKARRELGFEPRTNLRAGISLTTRWYQENGWLT